MSASRFQVVPAYLPHELYVRRLEDAVDAAACLDAALEGRDRDAIAEARTKLQEALDGLRAGGPRGVRPISPTAVAKEAPRPKPIDLFTRIGNFIRSNRERTFSLEDLYAFFPDAEPNTVRSTAARLAREPSQRVELVVRGVYRAKQST